MCGEDGKSDTSPPYVREKNGSNLSTSLNQICLGLGSGGTSKKDFV
ncbi:hypothetical protein Tco_1324517, partial [Tanacetum coccineum]